MSFLDSDMSLLQKYLHNSRYIYSIFLLALSFNSMADETDWLYFPMYARDTAHAVHLKALQFRSDGLLVSASRYPLASEEEWDAPSFQKAWYRYYQRLIDCQTGFFIDTNAALLDKNNQIITQHAIAHQQWKVNLQEQLNASYKWPIEGGEIFLACAAASSPAFLLKRENQKNAPQPLLAKQSMIETLKEDTALLYDKRFFAWEEKPLKISNKDFFKKQRKRYQDWKLSFDKNYQPMSNLNPNKIKEFLAEQSTQSKQAEMHFDSIEILDHQAISYAMTWNIDWSMQKPKNAGDAYRVKQYYLSDCESGLEVAQSRIWYGLKNNVLLREVVNMKYSMQHSASDAGLPFLCRYLKEANADEDNAKWPLVQKVLDEQENPEKVLLLIRQIWKKYQPLQTNTIIN